MIGTVLTGGGTCSAYGRDRTNIRTDFRSGRAADPVRSDLLRLAPSLMISISLQGLYSDRDIILILSTIR